MESRESHLAKIEKTADARETFGDGALLGEEHADGDDDLRCVRCSLQPYLNQDVERGAEHHHRMQRRIPICQRRRMPERVPVEDPHEVDNEREQQKSNDFELFLLVGMRMTPRESTGSCAHMK